MISSIDDRNVFLIDIIILTVRNYFQSPNQANNNGTVSREGNIGVYASQHPDMTTQITMTTTKSPDVVALATTIRLVCTIHAPSVE